MKKIMYESLVVPVIIYGPETCAGSSEGRRTEALDEHVVLSLRDGVKNEESNVYQRKCE